LSSAVVGKRRRTWAALSERDRDERERERESERERERERERELEREEMHTVRWSMKMMQKDHAYG
jgi:hypothetical protein